MRCRGGVSEPFSSSERVSFRSIFRDRPSLAISTCILSSTDLCGVPPSFNSYDDVLRLAGSVLSDLLLSVELDPGFLV